MSHVVKMKMLLKCLEAIKRACKRLGWTFVEGQQTYHWWGTDHDGRSVGDYPLPEGMTVADLGKCTHVIRVPGAKYEIGVVQKGTDFTLLYDFWSSGGLVERIGGKDANLFMEAYTIENNMLKAKQRGYTVTEQKLPDRVRLTVRRY